MNKLPIDIIENICYKLPINEYIYFISCNKELNKFKYILKYRIDDKNHYLNINKWCTICNQKIKTQKYILLICNCTSNISYPYYHYECLKLNINILGVISTYNCIICKKPRNILIIDKKFDLKD